MNPAEEMTANPGAAGSDEKSDQQLHTILENLGRVAPQDDLHSGLTPRLDLEALERKALDDRLGTIENEKKKRSSRGFTRYLLAICIGAVAILAWQAYGEAAKQMLAAKAPELGWSLETKRMIANLVEQLGWTKPPATSAVRPSALETPQAVPVAQTAPENVTPKAPAAPSIDPEQVNRMAMDLTALRQTVEQLAASQDQMVREIARLKAADGEILAKVTPAPPPPPPIAAAPAVAGRPAPGGAPSSANTQTDVALRTNCGPDVKKLCRGISWENGGVTKCLNSHPMELSPICVAYFNGQKGTPKATSPNR
jgi:hypothetical protein